MSGSIMPSLHPRRAVPQNRSSQAGRTTIFAIAAIVLTVNAMQPERPPVIVVHSLGHALAALRAAARAGRPIVLASAPDAGGYAGGGWFRELVAAARETVPDADFTAVLDCGEAAGAALAAIRAGVEGVVFTGRAEVARRLADIAQGHGVSFTTRRPAAALDLGDDFFAPAEELERRCAAVLPPP
jgi:hypothetical protein